MSSRHGVGGGGDFRCIGQISSCGRVCVDAIILKEVDAALDDADIDRSTVVVNAFPQATHFNRSSLQAINDPWGRDLQREIKNLKTYERPT